MNRTRMLGAFGFALILLSGAILSGCLISGPEKPPEFYSWIKIQPGDRFSGGPLRPAPDGYIYQLWAANVNTNPQEGEQAGLTAWKPLLQFDWEPENYLAVDESGSPTRLTVGNGVNSGVNVSEWDALMVSFQPDDQVLVDNDPRLGPIILFSNPAQQGEVRNLFSPLDLLLFFFPPLGEAQFTFISQSNKRDNPNADWRDGSEGEGIWFAHPEVSDRTTFEDSVYQTFTQFIFPDTGGAPTQHTIWFNEAHPESSFSNFGDEFLNQEADLVFIDGVGQHGFIVNGNDTTFIRGPQVDLGESPIVIDGEVVGYRYVSDDGSVCDLRVDYPWLSVCDTDPFESLLQVGDNAFTVNGDTVGYIYYSDDLTDTCLLRWDKPDSSVCNNKERFNPIIFDEYTSSGRQFIVIGGDTSVAPTLPPLLPPVSLFLFDYEAWVIFTPESEIPPLSLGRFQTITDPNNGIFGFPLVDAVDLSNRYTSNQGFDRNFHFPGEDFVENVGQHDPSLPTPYNMLNDPENRALKLWITMEPRGELDWAPDQPFDQMIVYSAWIPWDENFVDGAEVAADPDLDISEATRTMDFRNLNPVADPTLSLNNGIRWPTMNIYLSNVGP